ncbi:MAG: SOS response-associated peptidase [Bifidobacterium mongoliense]|uniref:SOS response-associated peptidase n=2 Tax=Bifidobacterium mongoliense TaxID=518643 RepID=UPI002F35B9B0
MAAMCGRFAADLDWGKLGLEYEADCSPGLPAPSWNLRPHATIGLLAQDRRGIRHLAPATWSLIPAWSSTDRLAYPTFNARIETALTKRTWSGSARATRALIPMTGYYERAKDHSPWYFHPADDAPLFAAGLYAWWRGLLTCTILTRAAIGKAAAVHDRMPVLVGPDLLADWIDPSIPGSSIVPKAAARSVTISVTLRQHEVEPITGDGPRLIEPALRLADESVAGTNTEAGNA